LGTGTTGREKNGEQPEKEGIKEKRGETTRQTSSNLQFVQSFTARNELISLLLFFFRHTDQSVSIQNHRNHDPAKPRRVTNLFFRITVSLTSDYHGKRMVGIDR